MKDITIGKLRGLQQISSQRGTITALALDHRQNLRKANPVFESDEQLSDFKLEVVALLASESTAVLLDPEVAAAQAISAGCLPGNKGLVVALESTGYTGVATARRGQIIPMWSVDKAKRMGANAVKLLVYYHPDGSTASEIENFVASVAEDCRKSDITLMLEPLSYSLKEGVKMTSDEKKRVVVETARRLTPLNIDILKAEFPLDVDDPNESLWESACHEITQASVTPWILLSAAADYDRFTRQVIAACNAGASGIAVGRAVWQESVTMIGFERLDFLRKIARERITRLSALCYALAKPFTEYFSAPVKFDWYKGY